MSDMLGPYLLGPNDENQGIYTGDARELAQAIPDESVDLIFTDPPYPKEFIPLYGWMAKMAARVLKPGGSLFTLAPHYWFPQVWDETIKYLDYHWLCCIYHPTVTHSYRCFPKRLDVYWKPLLWFTKGKYTGPFLADGVNTSKPDKQHHVWGQQEKYAAQFLVRFPAGTVVLDPLVGGGTTPAVCKYYRLNWLAFEIDPPTADLARKRVRETQPPLFVPQPEQIEIAF